MPIKELNIQTNLQIQKCYSRNENDHNTKSKETITWLLDTHFNPYTFL